MPSSISSIRTVTEISPAGISDTKFNLEKVDTKQTEFPEGGTAAWCLVIGGALIQLCGFGYIMAFGVYQGNTGLFGFFPVFTTTDFYTRHYLSDELPSAISWIGSVNAFLAASFGIISGALYDRGYFYYILIGGSLLESLSLFMLSLAQPGQYYQIFLAQGIGLGIAQGILYVPSMAVISQYFSRRRTLAMSLVASGSSLGGVIHPIMLNNLFNGGIGFANGVRISATFVSVSLLIACLLIRTRLDPPKKSVNYLSVGKGILRDTPFCIMCTGLFCVQIGFYYPLFYFQLDSIRHGNSETFSFYSLVLMNASGLVARLTTGFIAPYFGVPVLITISTAMCGVLVLAMIGLGSVPSVVVLGTIFGYFAGNYIALLAPLIALLTRDISELGARMGIAVTILSVGSLISGPIAGALLTSKYAWWRSSLFNGLICITGSALLVGMQFALTRRKCACEKQPEEV